MTNTLYTSCESETNTYCKIVQTVGIIPEQNNFIYDICYYIYFITFITVIISPLIILYKLINRRDK